MYRDDECAVCGVALPPDHVYCREHAAEVDDRLHEIGERLPRMLDDLAALGRLIDQVAPDTWEYLSDRMCRDEAWPPPVVLTLRLHADQVDVDVDTEPGRVRIALEPELATWMQASSAALEAADVRSLTRACVDAEGAGAAY